MRLLLCSLLALASLSATLRADDIVRIEVGKDYSHYSQSDLQRRVYDLERAVWQLQQRVFQLEASKPQPVADTWVCTIHAMGDTYTGTGGSKATATVKAVDNCKAAREGDGFFCKNPKCEQ